MQPNESREKPAYRPPLGIPTRDPASARPTIAAALLHALIVALILMPPLLSAREALDVRNKAAGGRGPAGGGGGGTAGAGALREVRERLRFIVMPKTPANVAPAPVPTPAVPKKEEPKPEVKPPEPPPVAPPESVTVARPDSVGNGASGGTGKDGTTGNGPGTGGGIGSGNGPGRGSGNGPGTGGGDDEIHGATVVALPILPIPVPNKVRPYRMVALFDVDTLGNATLITFNPSNDRGYNKRVKEMLLEMRFKPAVRRNGAPVRDTVAIKAEAL
jgi:protein TonB